MLDIDGFNREPVSVFARQDHAGATEANIRWAILEADLNFFFTAQQRTILVRQTFSQRERVTCREAEPVQAQLLPIDLISDVDAAIHRGVNRIVDIGI